MINRTDWETYHQAQGGSYSFLLTTLDTRDKTGQDAKEQYHEVRPMILNALRTTQPLGSPWMLTALARKLVPAPGSESFIIPTVYVVCAKPLLLKDSLLELLTLLRIEVHAGSLMFNNDLNWWFPSDRQYEKQVTMGRSIGVHGLGAQGGSGTFGGWVYSPKSGKLFGVTAGHVVLAQKSEIGRAHV